MLRRLIQLQCSLNTVTILRHGSYGSHRPKVFRVDPTRKAKNERISWSTNDTDTTTLKRDKNKIVYPYNVEDGGRAYYGFTYYPRYPDQEDPPITPSPLFMILRTETLKCKPKYQKQIFEDLGFSLRDLKSKVVIVKNTPEVNEKLYIIKNLIKIIPIKLPENLPKDADPMHCFLTEDGEFQYSSKHAVDPEKLKPHPNYFTLNWDTDFINAETRKTWYHAYDLKLA